MNPIIKFAVKSTRRLVLIGVVAVAGVVALLAGRVGGNSDNTPAAAAPAAAGNECGRVAAGFARAFFDRAAPDDQWRLQVASWVDPALAAQLPTINRTLIPAVTPEGMTVTSQEGSCDVTVKVAGGDVFPVVVERHNGRWLVTSWG